MKKKIIMVLLSSNVLLSSASFQTYASDTTEINNIDNIKDAGDVEILPLGVSYSYSNFVLSSGTSFSTSITLSTAEPYAKAFYTNKSSATVTMGIKGKGVDKTITIPAGSNGEYKWSRSGIGNKKYEVTIRCSSAT